MISFFRHLLMYLHIPFILFTVGYFGNSAISILLLSFIFMAIFLFFTIAYYHSYTHKYLLWPEGARLSAIYAGISAIVVTMISLIFRSSLYASKEFLDMDVIMLMPVSLLLLLTSATLIVAQLFDDYPKLKESKEQDSQGIFLFRSLLSIIAGLVQAGIVTAAILFYKLLLFRAFI